MAMRSASDPSMPEVNVRRNSGDQVSASSSTGNFPISQIFIVLRLPLRCASAIQGLKRALSPDEEGTLLFLTRYVLYLNGYIVEISFLSWSIQGRSEGVSDPLAPKIQRHSSEGRDADFQLSNYRDLTIATKDTVCVGSDPTLTPSRHAFALQIYIFKLQFF